MRRSSCRSLAVAQRGLCSRALARRGSAQALSNDQRALQLTRAAERRRFGLPVYQLLGYGFCGVSIISWWYSQQLPSERWSAESATIPSPLRADHLVTDPEEVEALLSLVRIVLSRHGIGLGHVPLRVRLLQEHDLIEGCTRKVIRPPPVLRGVESVGLKPGLSAIHAAQVLAHEYAHCWLWLQGFPPLERRLEEGLCELVSYLFLISCLDQPLPVGSPLVHDEAALQRQIRSIEANAHPDYGTGFRRCIEAMRGRSLHQLLRHVREYSDLPQPLEHA